VLGFVVMLAPAQLVLLEAALDRLAGLDALWLFGSEASGRTNADSDVDLGALFARRPSAAGLLAAREELEGLLGRPVDLVDLEHASPVLAMQVLRHGRLVAERSRVHRIRFTAALPGRYEDVAILRRPAEKLLRARLAHGRT
jgi:uncharacterized protein